MNIKFNNCEKFFGTSGYTSTSANYIANKAKEIVGGINADSIDFITTKVSSLNNNNGEMILSRGIDENQLDALVERQIIASKLNGLISWMREAIRAKETLLNQCEQTDFNTWMKENYPDVDLNTFGADIIDNPEPEDNTMTADEWAMNNMSIKEINEYLFLLAACSKIGKFIHPNGEYSKARAIALQKQDTSSVKDYQSSTVIYNYELSVPADVIEKKFFKMQELHREYQKRLNSIKFNIDNEVQKLNDQYAAACDKYNEIDCMNTANIKKKRAEYKTMFNTWKMKRLDELRKLKIIVPNELKETVDYVNNVQNKE